MQTSIDILNAVAKKLGGVTDYRLAKDSGIYHGTISSVRAGRCSLSRDNCAKAAAILGVEVGALIAIVTAEREENPDIRKSLLRVARKGMAAAAITAAIGLAAAPLPPAQASSAPQHPGQCLLCKVGAGCRRCHIRRTLFTPGRRPERRRAVSDRRASVREDSLIHPRDTPQSSPSVTPRKRRSVRPSPTLSPA